MQDAWFDRRMAMLLVVGRRSIRIPHACALIVALVGSCVGAQLPGAPVLQNAWAAPGSVVAINVAGGSNRSVYAAAGSWAPSARFQLIGGVGIQSGRSVASSPSYGFRVAVPITAPSSSMGLAAFAGVGGTGKHTTVNLTTLVDSTTNSAEVPLGVSVGWRRAMGPGRGFSVYAAPSCVFFTGGTDSDARLRVAAGVDVGFAASWGVTAGLDFGATRPRTVGGPTGTQFAVGVSYAMRRR